MSIRRASVGLTLLAGCVGLFWAISYKHPWRGHWAPPLAPVAAPATAQVPRLIRSLGLSDGDDYALKVLEDKQRSLLVVYPVGIDPVETAARWSLAIGRTGVSKVADHSRPGRTVLTFASDISTVLLAVGATNLGPFVSVSAPASPGHWGLLADEAAPPALRVLLPRLKAPGAGVGGVGAVPP